MKRFKKLLIILLVVSAMVLAMAGCGKKKGGVDKKAISKEIGIDVTAAEERYNNDFEEDSGNKLVSIIYKDNGLEELIKNAEHWNELPMSEDIKEALQSIVPDAEVGYYYFCNKRKGVDDKYDIKGILDGEKQHYVISIYDVKKMVLYYVEVK